jgi:hypothetical protein
MEAAAVVVVVVEASARTQALEGLGELEETATAS